MISQILASFATAPPDGQPCNDTVALGPVPDWVWLVVLGVGAVVVVFAVVAARQGRRR